MNILIVGSGGREHALAWKLGLSDHVKAIFCSPGNAGIATSVKTTLIPDLSPEDLLDLALARKIDLTVVGPEAPLVDGISDLFREAGLLLMGPSASAARLEGSKVFAKNFMGRHDIPTAAYRVFDNADDAERALKAGAFHLPLVIKADGLAAGKGVLICTSIQEALASVDRIMRQGQFGKAGRQLVVEEFLEGDEASFMILADGAGNIVPMAISKDHKQIFEGDRGPNTGGMGAYSTTDLLTPGLRKQILDLVIYPTITGMAEESCPFLGILYAGLMLTADGPRVLEFNVRLGDPEAQAVLPRLSSDLLELFLQAAQGDLSSAEAHWSKNSAVCVVAASQGYPGSYSIGQPVFGLEKVTSMENLMVFHAGTNLINNQISTSGGRVLGVTAIGPSLDEAARQAYTALEQIQFEGIYYRRDIASKDF